MKNGCTRVESIPGSFFRREGRPSSDSILIARMTDRPDAPPVPGWDAQRSPDHPDVAFPLTEENPLDIHVHQCGICLLTMISDIPWNWPHRRCPDRLYVNEALIVNPTFSVKWKIPNWTSSSPAQKKPSQWWNAGANEVYRTGDDRRIGIWLTNPSSRLLNCKSRWPVKSAKKSA